ncbi:MAG: response regulator [Desulfobacteraceae bacterium]|jgi:twitching motility two-component system response regulator PilH|nr:response regulator [Desulfobacteraceae bacterium]
MTKKVLVVDDDPDVRLFNTTVIEECGYSALEAENGEEGLAKVKKDRPDLVLLDVLMPRQSGIRLYRELKTDPALKQIRVVLLSGIAKKTFLRSQKALTEFGGAAVTDQGA